MISEMEGTSDLHKGALDGVNSENERHAHSVTNHHSLLHASHHLSISYLIPPFCDHTYCQHDRT